MDKREAIVSLNSHTGFFRHWISREQRMALTNLLEGEEGSHFITLLTELKARIEAMPKSYQTDGQGNRAVAYLHYFMGDIDAWITERDVGDTPDGDGLGEQLQAFGKITLTGNKEDAELGYISIAELIECGVELDLYWTPKTLKEC